MICNETTCLCLSNIINLLCGKSFNSQWPSNAICWHRSWSTLAQVMACCMMAPSHYLNQCWLIIKAVVWYSPEQFHRKCLILMCLQITHLNHCHISMGPMSEIDIEIYLHLLSFLDTEMAQVVEIFPCWRQSPWLLMAWWCKEPGYQQPCYWLSFHGIFWLQHHTHLTHWGRDKMAAIFQMTFSNAFSWMKMFKFRLRFHWSLFPRVQLTIFQHWFRKWLGTDQATSHYLNQCWLVYWCIYASLGLNELIEWPSEGIVESGEHCFR